MPLKKKKLPPYYDIELGTIYKTIVANLDQVGTAAPSSTTFKNDIGGFTIVRDSIGFYRILFATGTLTANKTYIMMKSSNTNKAYLDAGYGDTGTIYINTWNLAGSLADNCLIEQPIEIRVYN